MECDVLRRATVTAIATTDYYNGSRRVRDNGRVHDKCNNSELIKKIVGEIRRACSFRRIRSK
jgi:hypothetical protein